MALRKVPLSCYLANMGRLAFLSGYGTFRGRKYGEYADASCSARMAEKVRDLGALMHLVETFDAPYEAYELLDEQVSTD